MGNRELVSPFNDSGFGFNTSDFILDEPDPKPSIGEVDALANELANRYENHSFRRWYCKVINTLGIQKTRELAERADESKSPGRLFSTLAKEAMQSKASGGGYG
jgi:hypothetical protein